MLMHRRVLHAFLFVVSLLITMAPSLGAQSSSTGALTGTVTDSSGAAVPNVTVTALSAGTGASRSAMTGPDGAYTIGLLPPGSYSVKFEASGFKPVEVPSVNINVTETPVLNRQLEVGSQNQEITVQGEAEEAVQTTNATVGTVLAAQTITDLPLNSRNFTNLLGLSAGTNVAVFNATGLGKGTTDIAVNGSTPNQNNIQIDGATAVNWSSNGITADGAGASAGVGVPNPDSIQEFKIQTSQYDAGYGRNAGANVNLVTKSGTNQFHGSAFEFFRNTDLNANDFFLNASGHPRGQLNQNQFGGAVGGPVKKDKLFFFASVQETRQKNGMAAQGYSVPYLPSLPSGDRSTALFQQQLGAMYGPSTGAGACGTAATNGASFAGGVQLACNGSNINPVALSLLNLKNPDGTYYIPAATVPGGAATKGFQSTAISIPAIYKEHQVLGNLDYAINAKNTISAHYFYTDDPTNVPFNCGANGGSPGICLPDTAVDTDYTSEYFNLKLTTIVTNTVVNEARLSLQRFFTHQNEDIPFTDAQVGISKTTPDPKINFLDAIVVASRFDIGSVGQNPATKGVTSWEAADQVSWTHGRHTLRLGFEFERDRLNWTVSGTANATLTFQTFQDFLLGLNAAQNASPTGQSNVFSNGTNTAVVPAGGIVHGYRMPNASWFVQDDYKLSSRLTVNLGLRWEYDGITSDTQGRVTNFWPSLASVPGQTPATGTLAGFVVPSNFNFSQWPAVPVSGVYQSTHTIPTQTDPSLRHFAPRVGFAWQPTSSDRLVVRGGFGYFYDRSGGLNYFTSLNQNYPYAFTVAGSGSSIGYATFAQPFGGAPGTGTVQPTLGWPVRWQSTSAACVAGMTAGTTLPSVCGSELSETLMQSNYSVPTIQQWNLNVQYQFLSRWVLELGYVGSHGIREPSGTIGINEAQLASPTNPINGVTVNTTTNVDLRVPYLGFKASGMSMNSNLGDNKFNSLQANVRKQFSHGFQLQAAYTFSRDFQTAVNANALTLNDPNIHVYGLSPNYRPHRLTVNYSWNLPFGNHQGFLGAVTNGWNVAGVTTIQSGTPMNLMDTRGGTVYGLGALSTSTPFFAAGMGAGDIPTSGSVQQRLGGTYSATPFLNPNAFTTPTKVAGSTATIYGNVGYGIVRGPDQSNWDATIQKTTKVGGIHEDATLVFRTEFFNAFNHPQFSNPGTSITGAFGAITSTSVNPRLIQFALKYVF